MSYDDLQDARLRDLPVDLCRRLREMDLAELEELRVDLEIGHLGPEHAGRVSLLVYADAERRHKEDLSVRRVRRTAESPLRGPRRAK